MPLSKETELNLFITTKKTLTRIIKENNHFLCVSKKFH